MGVSSICSLRTTPRSKGSHDTLCVIVQAIHHTAECSTCSTIHGECTCSTVHCYWRTVNTSFFHHRLHVSPSPTCTTCIPYPYYMYPLPVLHVSPTRTTCIPYPYYMYPLPVLHVSIPYPSPTHTTCIPYLEYPLLTPAACLAGWCREIVWHTVHGTGKHCVVRHSSAKGVCGVLCSTLYSMLYSSRGSSCLILCDLVCRLYMYNTNAECSTVCVVPYSAECSTVH